MSQREVFGSRSLYAGTISNSPARVFNRHNFTNYAESRFGSLLVTNDFGIIGGRDQEDDESYRYRIHLRLISQSGSSEAALRFALLQVPGIQDVVFDRRAGTFTCYVYAITPEASSSLLSTVQDAIDQNVAVRGGGRWYQNGGPSFANLSPRLSLFSDPLRTVLAVKGSLRRAQQRRALDGSGPFRTTLQRRGKGSLRTAPLAGDHFAAILVPFFSATDTWLFH